MSQSYLELLKHVAPAEPPARLEQTARHLETLTQLFAAVIGAVGDASAQKAVAAQLSAATLARLANGSDALPVVKLTPEELEWARGLDTEEEILAGIREIRETGGLELKDFFQEIIDAASPNA